MHLFLPYAISFRQGAFIWLESHWLSVPDAWEYMLDFFQEL